MKVSYYLFFAVMCMNGFVIILQLFGIQPIVMTPFNVDTTYETFNGTALVEEIDPAETEFYKIGPGLQRLWNQCFPVIEDSFRMFRLLGMSENLLSVILLLWRAVYFGFIISFITGRDFMP